VKSTAERRTPEQAARGKVRVPGTAPVRPTASRRATPSTTDRQSGLVKVMASRGRDCPVAMAWRMDGIVVHSPNVARAVAARTSRRAPARQNRMTWVPSPKPTMTARPPTQEIRATSLR
jgi:hypothetical protein